MIKPFIKDKQIKCFKIKPNESIQSVLNKMDEDYDTSVNDQLFKKEAILWAKKLEESQQFGSRRKKEFEQLLKAPLFTETKIRVKFPNNTVWEATFSPREKVKDVMDLVT
mmetsp:Transcript_36088/g.32473  ORF Transcript_36088/g.32473 Transcript_36088/m.32473 type:complete len:110 (+) Transcript_36088:782-1111(+)